MNYVLLGKIVGTHGIKGEIKISSNSDFKSERFKVGNTLYIKNGLEFEPIKIQSYRVHKGLDLITFNDYTNINDILKYVDLEVYVDYKENEDLNNNEFYYQDLLDCTVYDVEDLYIGIVSGFRDVPQGLILEITKEDGKKSLIPFHEEFVKQVLVDKKIIIIDPIEGLL